MMNRKILASMLPVLLAAHMATRSAGAQAEILYDLSATPGIESRAHDLADGLSEGMARAIAAFARFEAGEIGRADAALQGIADEAQGIAARSEAFALILPASQASVEMLGDGRPLVIALATTLLRQPAPAALPGTGQSAFLATALPVFR